LIITDAFSMVLTMLEGVRQMLGVQVSDVDTTKGGD
jgi:hypothetical protein